MITRKNDINVPKVHRRMPSPPFPNCLLASGHLPGQTRLYLEGEGLDADYCVPTGLKDPICELVVYAPPYESSSWALLLRQAATLYSSQSTSSLRRSRWLLLMFPILCWDLSPHFIAPHPPQLEAPLALRPRDHDSSEKLHSSYKLNCNRNYQGHGRGS